MNSVLFTTRRARSRRQTTTTAMPSISRLMTAAASGDELWAIATAGAPAIKQAMKLRATRNVRLERKLSNPDSTPQYSRAFAGCHAER